MDHKFWKWVRKKWANQMTVATRASSLLEAILVFTHLNPWMNRLWFHCGSFRSHILTRKQNVWSWKHAITALLHRSTYWKLLVVQRCSRSELLHLWSASLSHRSFAEWLLFRSRMNVLLLTSPLYSKSAIVGEENKLASSSREKHDAQKRKHKDRQTA